MRPLRLGIDMDGVICDFNGGWIRLHREEFGTDLHPSMVTGWDGLHELGGFADMEAFWAWAGERDDRPSVFRHLEPFPGALETLQHLAEAGHRVVIITAKPHWAIPDTLRWLADHRVPAPEIHFLEEKYEVDCDLYVDDAPHNVVELLEHRPAATVCRFVRPWNHAVEGAVDVHDWADVHAAVTATSRARPSGGGG